MVKANERREANGQYGVSKLERRCTCGATLGQHDASNPGLPRPYEPNDCEDFKPARRQRRTTEEGK